MDFSPEFPFIKTLYPRQLEIFRCDKRFRVGVAGRRFGKTTLAFAEMLRAAQTPGSNIWYVAPDNRQTMSIAWEDLCDLTYPFWRRGRDPNKSDRKIYLAGNSTIHVNGALNSSSLRGHGIDFVVMDEYADIEPHVWPEIFRPALADRKGRALFIGTPQGRNHFFDLFEKAKTTPNWAAFQFKTAQGGIVAPDEILALAAELDSETFRQEIEGQFTNVGRHRVYYAFNKAVNVKPVSFDPMGSLVWALDFNVDPMIMLIMQKETSGGVVNVLEEIVIRPSANTEMACKLFFERANRYYQQTESSNRPLHINIYGDSAGTQRHTNATQTDWHIIRESFNMWRGTYTHNTFTTPSNPAVKDRVACVNARLCNARDEHNLFINPTCNELIRDLEDITWLVDGTGSPTFEINKTDQNRTHASDALGYFINQVFPMKPTIGHKSDGRIV